MTPDEFKTSIQGQLTTFDETTWSSPAQLIRGLVGTVCEDLTEGTNLFTGKMPTEPNDCIATYDSGGGNQEDRHFIDEAKVQIRSRSNSYDTGYNHLLKIKLVLQSIPKLNFSQGQTLIGIWITSNVAYIGRDSDERSLFSLNIKLLFEPPQQGNRNQL